MPPANPQERVLGNTCRRNDYKTINSAGEIVKIKYSS